jgi:nitrate/TMAO reductase-like tetraheme cytochrome c subunit
VFTISNIVLALIVVAILLNLYLVARPSSTHGRGGKMLAFVGIFALPVIVMAFGTEEHMEQSKRTEFCLSCHVMKNYGKSLMVDDNEFVPAAHFQNNRIPRDMACYTCHTQYTMYGDLKSKIRGLKHLYYQYLGTIPDSIKLYEKYSNRECLHCHEGSRKFDAVGAHNESPAAKDSILADTKSCMTSGCHDVIHNVHELKDATFWNPDSTKAKGGTDGTSN